MTQRHPITIFLDQLTINFVNCLKITLRHKKPLNEFEKLYLRSNPLTRDNAKAGPYAPIIRQLEANQTEVFY